MERWRFMRSVLLVGAIFLFGAIPARFAEAGGSGLPMSPVPTDHRVQRLQDFLDSNFQGWETVVIKRMRLPDLGKGEAVGPSERAVGGSSPMVRQDGMEKKPPLPPIPPMAICDDKDVIIIYGTDKDDVIAPESDDMNKRHVIFGFGGNDTLSGGNCPDTIYAGDEKEDSGKDIVFGKGGNDDVYGDDVSEFKDISKGEGDRFFPVK